MHGRLLSSNERVELCAHWDSEVREFALTAPGADEAPAKKKRKPRSR
jgi:hypothetical protein